jgi:hypothetical protein
MRQKFGKLLYALTESFIEWITAIAEWTSFAFGMPREANLR